MDDRTLYLASSLINTTFTVDLHGLLGPLLELHGQPVTGLPVISYRFLKTYICTVMQGIFTRNMPFFDSLPLDWQGKQSVVRLVRGYRFKEDASVPSILCVVRRLLELLEVNADSFDLNSVPDERVLSMMFLPFTAAPQYYKVPDTLARALRVLFSGGSTKSDFAQLFVAGVDAVLSGKTQNEFEFAGKKTPCCTFLEAVRSQSGCKGLLKSIRVKQLPDVSEQTLRHLTGLLATPETRLQFGNNVAELLAQLHGIVFALKHLPISSGVQSEFTEQLQTYRAALRDFRNQIPLPEALQGIVADYYFQTCPSQNKVPVVVHGLRPFHSSVVHTANALPVTFFSNHSENTLQPGPKVCDYGVSRAFHPIDCKPSVHEVVALSGSAFNFNLPGQVSLNYVPRLGPAFCDVTERLPESSVARLGITHRGSLKSVVVFNPAVFWPLLETVVEEFGALLVILASPVCREVPVACLSNCYRAPTLTHLYILGLNDSSYSLPASEQLEAAYWSTGSSFPADPSFPPTRRVDLAVRSRNLDDRWRLHTYSAKPEVGTESANPEADFETFEGPTKRARVL